MIQLRKFKLSDAPMVAKLCNNKKIWDHLRDALPYPYTEKDAIYFINEICGKEDLPMTFAIEYNDELVGCIGLVKQTDVYRLNAEMGYWIGEEYWNKGIATAAVHKLIEYAFNKLEVIRVYANVFSVNKASQKVLEKCGFAKEGVFKNGVIKNGIVCDEIRYARLKSIA